MKLQYLHFFLFFFFFHFLHFYFRVEEYRKKTNGTERPYRSIWTVRTEPPVRWQALGMSSALRVQRPLPHIFLSRFHFPFLIPAKSKPHKGGKQPVYNRWIQNQNHRDPSCCRLNFLEQLFYYYYYYYS